MKLLKSIKTLLIVATVTSLLACSKNPPAFPEIKHHYSIIKTPKSLLCIRSDILNFDPYTIANGVKVGFEECSDLEGYKLEDAKKLYNWMNDVNDWAKEQKLR